MPSHFSQQLVLSVTTVFVSIALLFLFCWGLTELVSFTQPNAKSNEDKLQTSLQGVRKQGPGNLRSEAREECRQEVCSLRQRMHQSEQTNGEERKEMGGMGRPRTRRILRRRESETEKASERRGEETTTEEKTTTREQHRKRFRRARRETGNGRNRNPTGRTGERTTPTPRRTQDGALKIDSLVLEVASSKSMAKLQQQELQQQPNQFRVLIYPFQFSSVTEDNSSTNYSNSLPTTG